jgi:type II secretory pathway component GspD/PulD (secretin)
MKRYAAIAMLISFFLLNVWGCAPLSEKESEIDKTVRMIKEARAGTSGSRSRNVYVSVERISVAGDQLATLAAFWRLNVGAVTVGSGGGAWRRAGLRLGLAGSRFGAGLRALSTRRGSTSKTTQELMVLSGRKGYIWTGRDTLVPLLRIVTPGGKTVVLQRARVGSLLVVQPEIKENGDILLDIHPQFRVLSGASAGQTYSVTNMRTRVILKSGQKLVLGRMQNSTADSLASGLFRIGSAKKQEEVLLTVTATRM